MNEPMHHIRKAIISRLNGSVTHNGSNVPVYNKIPRDASYPLIRVYSVQTNEIDQNDSSYNHEVLTRVEVVTKFDTNAGGELIANQLISECLNLLRTRTAGYLDLSADGFNVYRITNEGISYLNDDLASSSYYRAIMDLNVRVTEI